MDDATLLTGLLLGLLIAGLSVTACRTAMPSPILMLLAGVAVSLVPAIPPLRLQPELVLMLLLPPLLYSSGVGMSWRGFRSNLRPILLLAVGCVVFTAAAVAAVAHFALGLSWPVGFVLGAVVSPPDAVAPMAIARRLGIPRRILTILEGESLVNDATALVLFGFAVAAVGTGQVSIPVAAARFVIIVVAEVSFGVAVGWITLRLRHFANDPRSEIMLALATPFIAFWPPHLTGGSGVLACVAAGLYVSWNGPDLIRPATRLQGFFVWDLVTWTIEALVFLLTGLQARMIFAELRPGQDRRLLIAVCLITATVIIVRFLWVFPATYLPRLLWPPLARRDPSSGWRTPLMIGFTGLRGVVSVAAALSVPLAIDGRAFPDRDLILVVTFGVIVITLVGQGGLLPLVIRRLGLGRAGRAEADHDKANERVVRAVAAESRLRELDRAEAEGASATLVAALRAQERHRVGSLRGIGPDPAASTAAAAPAFEGRLLNAERRAIADAFTANRLTDEARRRIERELDLEEARSQYATESLADAGEDGHEAG